MSNKSASPSQQFVTRLVEFNIAEQAESDAFIRRVAACKSPEEIRKVVDATRELLKPGTPHEEK